MNPFKLIGWAAIAIAVIGAFVDIPYIGLILLLLGVVGAVAIATEDSVRVMVTALVLASLSHVWTNLPELGIYIAKIFSAGGIFVAGAAMTLIARNVWNRYKP
ncbi:MAG: hypothetical protein ACREVI_12500 [Steroidobacteraceae bacterium]